MDNINNIERMVEEYAVLRTKAKTIKERMDFLAKAIKDYMSTNFKPDAKGSYYSQNDSYIFGSTAKKTVKLDENKALKFFGERNLLDQVTDTKIVLNEDKVSKLLEDKVITQEDLESLVNIKTSYSVDVKAKEVKEEIVEVQVASRKPTTPRKLSRRR